MKFVENQAVESGGRMGLGDWEAAGEVTEHVGAIHQKLGIIIFKSNFH